MLLLLHHRKGYASMVIRRRKYGPLFDIFRVAGTKQT